MNGTKKLIEFLNSQTVREGGCTVRNIVQNPVLDCSRRALTTPVAGHIGSAAHITVLGRETSAPCFL